jgi:hypothetical protein
MTRLLEGVVAARSPSSRPPRTTQTSITFTRRLGSCPRAAAASGPRARLSPTSAHGLRRSLHECRNGLLGGGHGLELPHGTSERI